MDGDGKKPLKTVITNFYKLHMNKGKEYVYIQKFQEIWYPQGYNLQMDEKDFEENGNFDGKKGPSRK